MTTAIHLMLQLLPALSGAPLGPALSPPVDWPDSSRRIAPAPLLRRDGIDWTAIREQAGLARQDTARDRRRPTAIEYSNGYYTRLKLHRWLSFAMLPLFAGSYFTGDQILRKGDDAPGWARSLHGPFAVGTAVVFSANTVTGIWNLWASRKDPAGRTKRWVHSVLFMAAGAGFVYAATKVEDSDAGGSHRNEAHRNIALVSMGISVSSWALMLFFK